MRPLFLGRQNLRRKTASKKVPFDLRDTEFYMFKQLSRPLDAALQHVPMEWRRHLPIGLATGLRHRAFHSCIAVLLCYFKW